jgi:tetratricopeptide (TPR) repeat protein
MGSRGFPRWERGGAAALERQKMGRRARQLARCKAMLAIGVCTGLLTRGSPLAAQTDDENARRHFESGASYLQQSDNENALREFQAAYSLSKRPVLLLNIANVYERMGKPKEAVDSLTRYLEEDPKTAERTTVETRIANLKKRIDTAPDAGISPAPVGGPTATIPPSTPTASPVAATGEPPPPAAPNRLPAYVAFGVGGAAAIGALVTGIVANGKFKDAEKTCKPNCSDSTVSSIKSMAVVSDILTGVAVAGVGVGAVLFFIAKPASPEAGASLRPSIIAGTGPGGTKVEATWRF